MSIGSVSTVPYLSPLPPARTNQPAADVTTVAIAASPALTSPPLRASATTAVLISQQGAGSLSSPSGVDLSGEDLRQVDHSKLDLKNANLKDANLSGKDQRGLNFSGVYLSSADLSTATLTKTNLSGVATLVSTTFDNASLKRAKLIDAYIGNLAAIKLQGGWESSFVVSNLDLSGANLSGTDIQEIRFRKPNFQNTSFNGASRAKFTNFIGSNLDGASFQRVSGHVAILSSSAQNVDFTHVES